MGKYNNFNQTFQFFDLEGNSVLMSVAEQIEYINDSHSDDFIPYDASNWIEGMLEFGCHSVIFLKGQVFIHRGKRVVLSRDTHITEKNRYIKTNKGKLHIHHCLPSDKRHPYRCGNLANADSDDIHIVAWIVILGLIH